MPALAKIKSRDALSCWRSRGRSTSSSRPFHLRTLPATITVSTLVRSISDTTAPGTWLSGATLIASASRITMSASLPGVREPTLWSSFSARAVHRDPIKHVPRTQQARQVGRGSAVFAEALAVDEHLLQSHRRAHLGEHVRGQRAFDI